MWMETYYFGFLGQRGESNKNFIEEIRVTVLNLKYISTSNSVDDST